jgi:hypothetical protein
MELGIYKTAEATTRFQAFSLERQKTFRRRLIMTVMRKRMSRFSDRAMAYGI